MKNYLTIILMIVLGMPVISQESFPLNRLGLNVEYGIGRVALNDEYISAERYTGSLQYIGVWYGRLIDRKGWQLGITNQDGSDLTNHAIRAEFSRVSLNFDQFFQMKAFNLLAKPASWYFGPSVEYFEYELINQFSSNHKVFSELIMVSMGINAMLEWELSNKLTLSAFVRSNVIGVNAKTHDERRHKDQNSILQTLVKANNLNGDLVVRYRMIKRISIGLKGKAQYTRSTGWEQSQNFVNSVILFAIVHF